MNSSNKTSEVLFAFKFFLIDNWFLAIVLFCVSIFVSIVNRRLRLFSKAIQDADIDPSLFRLFDFIVKTNIDACNNGWSVFSLGIGMLVIEDGFRASLDQVITDEQAIQIARSPNFFGVITLIITIILFVLQLQSIRAMLRELQAFWRKLGGQASSHLTPED